MKVKLSHYVTASMKPGNCYELMFDLVMTNPANFVLVHGAPVHAQLNVRYGHAWAEAEDASTPPVAITWTERTGFVALPACVYYLAGVIDQAECVRYSAVEAKQRLAEHGHYGPWDSRLKGLLHADDEDSEDNEDSQEDT